MEIIEKIKKIHQSSRMTYGYRRIHAELRGNMMDINHKKIKLQQKLLKRLLR
ncbi:IS3 family transposase (plasmid) [Candidatus Bandiella numerosa]|uniref:IS3 family transposase n=1 Tax=Candidatus Bandiella numerosa TaxID=2570586 RepID=UPI00249F8844|nr:IS3 family transposase [Candidatus Bandiella numerosa]WHA05694.1 IS3 family transposase [Candidatus Bandiella numerosa]